MTCGDRYDVHTCGLEKGHDGRHMCSLPICYETWSQTVDERELDRRAAEGEALFDPTRDNPDPVCADCGRDLPADGICPVCDVEALRG